MPPDDIEFDDLDTEDDADENQAPADLVAGDTGFPDEEEIDVKVADAEPETGEKETKGEEGGEPEESEGKHKRPNRLQRERRRVREERQRRECAEGEVQRLLAENAALAARARITETGSDEDIDREIQEKTKRFREVRSQFDPAQADEEADLIRDLAGLELRKEHKKAEAARAKEQPSTQQQPAQPQAPPKPHRNVQAWLDDNDWFDDPKYERETRRARAIDAQVSADGYRPEDEDYFEEVERRMQVAGIKVPGRKNGSNGANRKESTVAGRVDVPTGGKHSVILTRDDLATLEKLGQNVRDKKVLEEYARNKRREEQRAGA